MRLSFISIALALGYPTFTVGQIEPWNTAEQCAAIPPLEFLVNLLEFTLTETLGPKGLNLGRILGRQTAVYLPSIEIKTWVHVVATSNKSTDGYLSDEAINQQMIVLNDSYRPHNISFVLEGIDKTINTAWAMDTVGSEILMKKALRKGSYKTLNLYYLRGMRQNALGFCTFPNRVALNSTAFWLDGCTQRFDTVPGGSAVNFNQGKTTTHEVGHWFGLVHTFQGNNCTGDGDFISDTPAQASSTFGCPASRDSCPGQPGTDLVNNFMDYSFDKCYTSFSDGQKARMFDMYQKYRANAV